LLSEFVFAIFWMLVGATFYSFLVSNISSLVASMDEKAAVIQ